MKNKPDLTIRNAKAYNKRLAALEKRVKQLEDKIFVSVSKPRSKGMVWVWKGKVKARKGKK